jgi:hypothetical protein
VKCKLRLILWCEFYLAFIHDSLWWAWQSISFQTEGLSSNNTCWNHALAVKWCARFLPVAWSGAVMVLFSATIACWWQWPASSLPSPPGLAPGLSFSSWTCCWSPVLLLLGLVLSFSLTPWFCWEYLCDAVQEMVLFLGWFPVVKNGSCFSWWCSSSRQLGLYCCYGAASTTLLILWLSYLWAMYLHASLRLISSSLGHAVKLLCALLICTPVTLKEQMLYLAINSMMQWQNLCPSLRVLMSTHASILVDSVGPPSAEVWRAAASFP